MEILNQAMEFTQQYSLFFLAGMFAVILILVICSYAPYGCYYGFTMAGSLDLYCFYTVTCLNLQMQKLLDSTDLLILLMMYHSLLFLKYLQHH